MSHQTTLTIDQHAELELQADYAECEFRSSYTGRGRDTPCVGISGPLDNVLSALMMACSNEPELADLLSRTVRIDDMGRGAIVYFPRVQVGQS